MARRLTQILVFGPDDATGSSAIQVNGKSDLLMHLAKAPRVREEFPATVDLSLVVFGGSPWGRQTLKKRQVLHLVYDDGTRRGFRIRSVRPILTRSSNGGGLPDGAFDMEVKADSILRDLADARLWRTLEPESFVTETVSLTGMAGDDVLEAILSSTWNAPSWFQAAAVQPLQVAAAKPQVIGVAMSALEALDLLCERISAGGKPVWYTEPTWNSSDSKWEITLATDPLAIGAVDASNRPAYAPSGGGVSSAPNLLELSIEDESGDYFSRIMPVAGPLNTGIAKARFVASGSDQTGGLNGKTRIYFEDDFLGFPQPPFIFKDNQMKGLYIAGDGLFTPQLITQTGIDDGTGKMFIDIDAELMTLPETELHFETASGSECPFIVDADRESEYGEKMAPRVAFEDVIPYANELVRSVGASADLSEGLEDGDGNWVPTGWELVGDATSEEETDSLFVQNGTSSVKVTADAGDGIQTGAYTFTPTDRDKVVAAMMRVITVSGRVRMTAHLTETTTSEEKVYPTGEDQIEFTALSPKEGGISFDLPEGWAEANIQFRLTALVDGTEFYVDAATITRSTDPQPYRADMGPEALFREAARYLATHGNEAPRYRARVLDKGVQDPDNFDEILLGRYVEVKAAPASGSYQIDAALRVVEIEYDEDRSTVRLFKDLVLSEKLPDLSDRFRTRAPIPEPDRPAPVQDPHVRTVNLLSDVSGLPGSAENRAVMVRRAVNGGPVVNALYVSDPTDTSSTADGVLVIAGSDGVRWKLQMGPEGADVRLWGVLADGSTDDTTSFQSAAIATIAAGVRLNVSGLHVVLNGAEISASNPSINLSGATIEAAPGATFGLKFKGTSLSKLSGIHVGGFRVHASDRLAVVQFEHVDNCSVKDVWGTATDGTGFKCARFNNCSHVQVDGVMAVDMPHVQSGCVSFSSCSHVRISNLTSVNCGETLDFGATDYIEVDGVMALDMTQEAIDCGNIEHAMISNVFCTGGVVGIRLKTETAGGSVKRVRLKNITCLDQTFFCMSFAYDGTQTGLTIEDVSMSGVTCITSEPGAYGLFLGTGTTNSRKRISIRDFYVDADYTGITIGDVDRITLVDGYATSSSHAPVDLRRPTSPVVRYVRAEAPDWFAINVLEGSSAIIDGCTCTQGDSSIQVLQTTASTKTFEVAEDHSGRFQDGYTFEIEDGDNAGTYTCDGTATYSSGTRRTSIVVSEAVASDSTTDVITTSASIDGALRISSTQGVEVKGCHTTGAITGTLATGAVNLVIDGGVHTGGSGRALELNGLTGAQVRGGRYSSTSSHALRVNSCSSIEIANTVCASSGGVGLNVLSSSGIAIVGGRASSSSSFGLNIQTSSGVQVIGGQYSTSTSSEAVRTFQSTEVTLVGIDATAPSSQGVRINSSKNVSLIGSQVHDCSGNGVNITIPNDATWSGAVSITLDANLVFDIAKGGSGYGIVVTNQHTSAVASRVILHRNHIFDTQGSPTTRGVIWSNTGGGGFAGNESTNFFGSNLLDNQNGSPGTGSVTFEPYLTEIDPDDPAATEERLLRLKAGGGLELSPHTAGDASIDVDRADAGDVLVSLSVEDTRKAFLRFANTASRLELQNEAAAEYVFRHTSGRLGILGDEDTTDNIRLNGTVRATGNVRTDGVFAKGTATGASGTDALGNVFNGGIVTTVGGGSIPGVSDKADKIDLLTENGGEIGGTNNGDLPDLSGTPTGTDALMITQLRNAIRELAAAINAMND